MNSIYNLQATSTTKLSILPSREPIFNLEEEDRMMERENPPFFKFYSLILPVSRYSLATLAVKKFNLQCYYDRVFRCDAEEKQELKKLQVLKIAKRAKLAMSPLAT